MRRISDTVTRLAAMDRARSIAPDSPDSRLATLPPLPRNPGALTARTFVPAGLPARAPLVVALHGCTQTASGYDHGTGWSQLAEREGFALLLPEQSQANNPNRCFNWFQPGDIARTGGEAESIALMVRAMVDQHHLDPARVYVTGLSAGGAMTAAMLATYPELFAGGAIIGGLPYGCARTAPEAFDRMRGAGAPNAAASAAAVRAASDSHPGRWPTVSIWQGTADSTVSATNAARLGDQWRDLHGLPAEPTATDTTTAWTHRQWHGPDGQVAVEEWMIAGMGHGVPIDPNGPSSLGVSGPYMLDARISSTAMIAAAWGLAPMPNSTAAPAEPARVPTASKPAAADAAGGIRTVIEDALKKAGLMQ